MTGTLLVVALLALLLAGAAEAASRGEEGRTPRPLPSPEEVAKLPPDGGPEFNRLIHASSPYLLQHARNPVDWYQWGEEASATARREGKLIFLSIGYSTCHWCHVMERESFEQESVARVLNEYCVSIKVDREERPDLDAHFMNVTQMLTGQGGWPNNLFLTPERKPFYAGTYFPPADSRGRPGLATVVRQLGEAWRDRRQAVEAQAEQVATALAQLGAAQAGFAGGRLSWEVVDGALGTLRRDYDEQSGGFGGAPKFPPHSSLALLARECGRSGDESLLRMFTETLDAMARGGIHDHVGGGFHRYAVDRRWFLPHFEKMLYDNAQLAVAYIEGYRLTGSARYAEVARGTLDWELREMTGPEGAFSSGIDADSEGVEGKFYVWTRKEILKLLGEQEGGLFCRVYDVLEEGNFREEATGQHTGANILALARPLEVTAKALGMEPEGLLVRLRESRERLLAHRNERVRPHTDDKRLVDWNGLMVRALARAGSELKEPRYTDASRRTAEFILTTMRTGDGRLLHSYRAGKATTRAYLDDYVFLAEGLLELREATGEERWLAEARKLMDTVLGEFADPSAGGFYTTSAGQSDLPIRLKEPLDSSVPSGNAAAARVLFRLGTVTGERRYLEEARRTVEAFSGLLGQETRAADGLALAASLLLEEEAPAEDPRTQAQGALVASGSPVEAQRGPVIVRVTPSQARVAAGETVHVTVQLALDKGWHVNSHAPTQKELVPTEVMLADGAPATLGPVSYPPGEDVTLGAGERPVSVYLREARIEAAVTINPGTPAGLLELPVVVRFQAASDRSCLAPEEAVLRAVIEVTPAGFLSPAGSEARGRV
jgi:hypothetical protein